MGKVLADGAASDTSVDERRKVILKEQKVRTKKKKRKRDLTDLHQRLFKSKKDKGTKIDGKLNNARCSKRKSNRILPSPPAGIYRNGATGKEIHRSQIKQPLNDLNNARLEGNVLKLLDGYNSKAEGVVIENASSEEAKEPLLDCNVRHILQSTHFSDKRLSPVLGKVDGKKKQQKDEYTEIHECRIPECSEFPQKPLERKKQINSQNFHSSALNKYKELCKVICTESFEQRNFLDHFSSDPLTMVKRKLRNIYAESFRSQYLRHMIKRGTILNEVDTPSTSVENQLPPNTEYRPLYTQDEELVSGTADNTEHQLSHKESKEGGSSESQNPFLLQQRNFNVNAKRNEFATSNLLFDSSLLHPPYAGMKNFIEPEMTREKTRKDDVATDDESAYYNNLTSLEVNHSASYVCRNNNTIDYFEANDLEGTKEKNRPARFVPSETNQSLLFSRKNLLKRKNQRTQTVHLLNSGLRRLPVKQNLKVAQQVKLKNLKHVPRILRRCNNAVANNNSRLNLFQESMHINKEPGEVPLDVVPRYNVLFTPQSLTGTELSENSKRLQMSNTVNTMFDTTDMKDLKVQTCVMASPSLRNDEICFSKDSRSQPIESKLKAQKAFVSDIFMKKKNPTVQKTVMFTKKDSRNIGHCLYANTLITDGTSNSNANVCIIRKNAPVHKEKSMKTMCTVHKNCQRILENCQRIPENCYTTVRCSQNSNDCSYGKAEFKEASAAQMQNIQVHQKPVICEKVLLKRIQQHPKYESQKCHNDQNVCYVVVDQCKDANNIQECSSDNISHMEKPATVSSGHYCQEDMADVGILKGVQNLKILPVEERESQMRFANNQYIENAVLLEEQPIKYLAFENNSKAQKIPIYTQSDKHVGSVDKVEVVNSGVNYRLVSCPQESTQKLIILPTCEQNKVVYVKQHNVAHSNVPFEERLHPRKVILYRPEVQCVKESSNVCEVHVPKQTMVEIRKTECDTIVTNLQQAENVKKSKRGVNWEEVHYHPSHGHDGCARSQAIFYQK